MRRWNGGTSSGLKDRQAGDPDSQMGPDVFNLQERRARESEPLGP